MKTDLYLRGRTLNLERYPVRYQHKSLQAWDAADELVIEYVESLLQSKELTLDLHQCLILNDEFGALCVWFEQCLPIQLSDSWIAKKATDANYLKNHLDPKRIKFIKSTDVLSDRLCEPIKLVIIKIPKNLSYLEHQLAELSKILTPDTILVAGGKVKSITRSVIKLFEKYIGTTQTSLAQKKARLIFSTVENEPSETLPQYTIEDPAIKFTLINLPNVFSREQLDIGARLLLQTIQKSGAQRFVDLGCGNGVIGIKTLLENPSATVYFVDESFMAIESARLNLLNAQGHTNNAKFVISNCLEEIISNSEQPIDCILCNPPFHQQNTITEHIAYQMFNESKKILGYGGILRVVANRHLGYVHKLNKLFNNHEVIANNKKFSVIECFKSK